MASSLLPLIRRLPDTLVNQIAAGEVVERPAACIKELVENALDAGASRVAIETREGGIAAISITDNGHGMGPDELPLALTRHATSKLPEDNLDSIHHLGFRGEALPSIAAVAKLKITSRTKGAPEAYELSVEGGKMGTVRPAAAPEGTKVEVRDLFFATPARLKFLKSAETEYHHILETLENIALAWPGVSFSLVEEGRRPWRVDGATGLFNEARLQRLNAVMASEFAANAVPVEAERQGAKLTGWAGLPTLNRAHARDMHLFVNNRPVRDRSLISAVRAAYGDLIPHGRHAVSALFLEMQAADVDVNVHPAKLEVRFRDAALIRGLIINALRKSLEAHAGITATTLSQAALGAFQGRAAAAGGMNSYAPQAYAPQMQAPISGFSDVATPFARNASQDNNPPAKEDFSHPLGAAVAQLHATYIVTQTEDGLLLVDQHAAHERLVYERMKHDLMDGGIKRQGLLIPEVVELSEAEASRLLKGKDALASLGLVIESFSGSAVAVREVPALLAASDIKKLVRDLAGDLSEWGESARLKEKLDEVLATIACHAAVRAGRRMNGDEMNALLRQMETTCHAGQCNHGRPTYIELKRSDIEKLFERK